MTENDSRRFELSLEIDASPEAVWSALTEARELERWFPLRAEVEPRPGGRYFLSWENEWQDEGRIQIFEPNRHLRTSWAGERADRAAQLAVDYHLEGRGGRTVLRLVHSGFGRDASWDREFDGISLGWSFELRSLRHYLERHRGQDRHVVYLLRNTGREPAEAWRMALEELGAEIPEGLAEGDAYTLDVGCGERFSGRVLDSRPPRQFAASVETFGDALFRIEIYGDSLNLWLAVWGGDGSPLVPYRERWTAMLDRLFPVAAPAPS